LEIYGKYVYLGIFIIAQYLLKIIVIIVAAVMMSMMTIFSKNLEGGAKAT